MIRVCLLDLRPPAEQPEAHADFAEFCEAIARAAHVKYAAVHAMTLADRVRGMVRNVLGQQDEAVCS